MTELETIEIGRLLRRAARSANRVYRSRIAELDLTHRQAAALLALVEKPGMSLGALAETMGADQPTASALVDRLLAADLVRRETDPEDRRRARLQPTDAAMAIAKKVADARRESEQLIRHALGPEDSDSLVRVLIRLIGELAEDTLSTARGRP